MIRVTPEPMARMELTAKTVLMGKMELTERTEKMEKMEKMGLTAWMARMALLRKLTQRPGSGLL